MIDSKYSTLDLRIISIIIALIPVSLIAGPAIPDILLSLVGLYFIVISFNKKLLNFYLNYFFLISITFYFCLLLSSLFSDYPLLSMTQGGSIFYFRYIFFVLAIWYLLEFKEKFIQVLLITITFCLFILTVDSLFEYLNGHNLFNFEQQSGWRVTSLFKDENILGRYVSFFSAFGFILIHYKKNFSRKDFIFSYLILFSGLIVAYLSGERTAFFQLSLFILIVFLILDLKNKLRFLLSLIITLIILFSILNINPNVNNQMINQTYKQISNTEFRYLPFSNHHLSHLESAYKMFIDKPVIGVGTNLFRFKCEEKKYFIKNSSGKMVNSCSTHPHNYYLQILSENGLVGISFLVFFYFFVIFIFFKNLIILFYRKSSKKIIQNKIMICILLLVLWFPLIPHMSFFNNWYNVLLMFPLGFFLKDLDN